MAATLPSLKWVLKLIKKILYHLKMQSHHETRRMNMCVCLIFYEVNDGHWLWLIIATDEHLGGRKQHAVTFTQHIHTQYVYQMNLWIIASTFNTISSGLI